MCILYIILYVHYIYICLLYICILYILPSFLPLLVPSSSSLSLFSLWPCPFPLLFLSLLLFAFARLPRDLWPRGRKEHGEPDKTTRQEGASLKKPRCAQASAQQSADSSITLGLEVLAGVSCFLLRGGGFESNLAINETKTRVCYQVQTRKSVVDSWQKGSVASLRSKTNPFAMTTCLRGRRVRRHLRLPCSVPCSALPPKVCLQYEDWPGECPEYHSENGVVICRGPRTPSCYFYFAAKTLPLYALCAVATPSSIRRPVRKLCCSYFPTAVQVSTPPPSDSEVPE